MDYLKLLERIQSGLVSLGLATIIYGIIRKPLYSKDIFFICLGIVIAHIGILLVEKFVEKHK